MQPDKINNLVHELRKELEKLDRAELWNYLVNMYYRFCETRDLMDFEAGRLAYVFYKRKGGKKEYRWFSFKFNRPKKRHKRFLSLWIKLRRKKENRQAKRGKRPHITDFIK